MIQLQKENKFQTEVPADVPFPCNVTGITISILKVKYYFFKLLFNLFTFIAI